MRLSTPPSDVAGAHILTSLSTSIAPAAPPATLMDNIPPNMDPICFVPDCCDTATACIG